MTGRGYYGALALQEALSGIGDQYARLNAQKRAEAARAAEVAAANAREDARYKTEIERQDAADVAYAQTYNTMIGTVNPATYTPTSVTVGPPLEGGFTLPAHTLPTTRPLPSFLQGGGGISPAANRPQAMPLNTPTYLARPQGGFSPPKREATQRPLQIASMTSNETRRSNNPVLQPVPLTPAGGQVARQMMGPAMQAAQAEAERANMDKKIGPIIDAIDDSKLPDGITKDDLRTGGFDLLNLVVQYFGQDLFEPRTQFNTKMGYMHGVRAAANIAALPMSQRGAAWDSAWAEIGAIQNPEYLQGASEGLMNLTKGVVSNPYVIPLSRPGGGGGGGGGGVGGYTVLGFQMDPASANEAYYKIMPNGTNPPYTKDEGSDQLYPTSGWGETDFKALAAAANKMATSVPGSSAAGGGEADTQAGQLIADYISNANGTRDNIGSVDNLFSLLENIYGRPLTDAEKAALRAKLR